MLETVRSRQRFGAIVVVLLPACAAFGYYLREREEERVKHTSLTADSGRHGLSSSEIDSSLESTHGAANARDVQDRIRALRRQHAQLDAQAAEIQAKLARARTSPPSSSSSSSS
ncbi:hypothetical protein OIV83_003818 [Microbotryomycetes sp. JL201]|nr:hypothetical protein OIV83_003818 [Microbotryomycetes sp. JL201]